MFRQATLIFLTALTAACSSDGPVFRELNVRSVRAVVADSVVLVDSIAVIPVLYSEVPDLSNLETDKRKRTFISLMLPSLLIAEEKRDSLRTALKYIVEKEAYSEADSLFYWEVRQRFKAKDSLDLMKKLQTPPHSLALAQAVIESGWGTSRFFRQGNNVYGVWSYRTSEPRIAAEYSRGTGPVYLRKYHDIAASVDDYYRLLSTSRAYRKLRDVLYETRDPMKLADALINYSELKHEYIRRLKSVIRTNDLTRYDSCYLHPDYIEIH